MKILLWGDVAGCVVLFVLAGLFGGHTLWYAIGLTISAVSLIFWLIARVQLGSAFTLVPESRFLVTNGLRSKIRHPIYVFACANCLGSLLALQAWPILALWPVLVIIEIFRARREERVLSDAFGKEYYVYRSKTWF